MFFLKARSLVQGGGSFFLCLAAGLVWRVSLPFMEVYFPRAHWCAFACGALTGLALGLKRRFFLPSLPRILLPGAAVFLFFLFLSPAYGILAPLLPGKGILLFLGLAGPPLVVFLPLGRLLSHLVHGGRRASSFSAAGGLLGLLAASLLYARGLEGSSGAAAILAVSLLVASFAAWLLPRLTARAEDVAPGGTISGSRVLDVAARLEGRFPEPVFAMTGSAPSAPVCFLMGAALSSVYPVTRRFLMQLYPDQGGAEVEILGTLLAGAVLGSLLLALLFPKGRLRNGVVLLGAIAVAGSMFLLAREFAFTQNIGEFAGFRRYLESLRAGHATFLNPEVVLYSAFTGVPAFSAGIFLGGLRGSLKSFLLGTAAGCLLGSGLIAPGSAASDLVRQALFLALAGAFLFSLQGFFAGRTFMPFIARLFFLGAASAVSVIAVCGSLGMERSNYPDIPLPGEKDLLFFEAAPEGDLRVTAGTDGRTMVRIDTRYLWSGRGLKRVGELAGSLPRLAGKEGKCLVAGPLAPVAAPMVLESASSALETVPLLARAEPVVARREGLETMTDAGRESRGVVPFLMGARGSYDTVLFLPPPPGIDFERKLLSREIFEVVEKTLVERGAFWLCLDTAELDAPSAGRIAGAFAEVFEHSFLWFVDDGFESPFLVLAGLKGRDRLDPDRLAGVLEEDLARRGPAAMRFRTFGGLAEFLLAGPEGMARLGEIYGRASAARPFHVRPLSSEETGFEAVRRLLEVLPPASLEDVFGRTVPDEEERLSARRSVLEGLALHGRNGSRINGGHDFAGKLFREEFAYYRRAFAACPDTAFGRRILAKIASVLIDAKEFQVGFEMIREAAGNEPRDVVLRYDLGFISFELLDFAAAAPHFAAATEGDPHFTDAFLYGGLNAFALGRKGEAARLLEKARALDSRRVLLYEPLARSLLDLGKPGEAARIVREGLKLAPGDEGLKALVRLIGTKEPR